MKKHVNVLSFFDGISAGQEALRQLGVQVDNYYAIEIDSEAIKVTQSNFPNTIQAGNILRFEKNERAFVNSLPVIDLVFAGSPCQGFSKSGKGLGLDDPRSKLFFNFHKILKKINERRFEMGLLPVPFFFENVVMSKSFADQITKHLNVPHISLDAVHYSPCARPRFYWTNLNIPKSIFEKYSSNKVYKDIMVAKESIKRQNMVPMTNRGTADWKFKVSPGGNLMKRAGYFWHRLDAKGKEISHQATVVLQEDSKMSTFLALGGGWGAKSGLYERQVKEKPEGVYSTSSKNKIAVRPYIDTCEVAMGFPIGYTSLSISSGVRRKHLGNSWHVVVVKMIIESYCTRMGWVR